MYMEVFTDKVIRYWDLFQNDPMVEVGVGGQLEQNWPRALGTVGAACLLHYSPLLCICFKLSI